MYAERPARRIEARGGSTDAGAAARADATLRMGVAGVVGDDVAGAIGGGDDARAATEAATLLRGVLAFGPPGANAMSPRRGPTPRGAYSAPRREQRPTRDCGRSSREPRRRRVASRRRPRRETRRALVDAVVRAGVPSIYRVHGGGSGRRALFTAEATRDAPAARHPVAAAAALGPDGGETAAASAAAAAAAANLAAAVLDAAVAASAAAAYGVGANGVSDPAVATEAATDARRRRRDDSRFGTRRRRVSRLARTPPSSTARASPARGVWRPSRARVRSRPTRRSSTPPRRISRRRRPNRC